MSSAPAAGDDGQRRGLRPLTVIVLLAVGIVALFAGGAFLPRWWSHRIADQAGGSFSSGIGLGLFYGFTFTLLALGLLWFGLHRVSSWKGRLLVVAAALLVASPNLLTLGIVLGSGGAAHAAERTLDVDAPGFRASSLAGALAGATALLAAGMLLRSRRRAKDEARALRAERDAAGAPPA